MEEYGNLTIHNVHHQRETEIYSINNLISSYYVTNTIWGAKGISENKTKFLLLMDLPIQGTKFKILRKSFDGLCLSHGLTPGSVSDGQVRAW